jgi:cellobiose phosphorylase
VQKPLNDDLLWLPFVTLNYLRETADWSVLEEVVPFLARDGHAPESATLYDHCRRAIDSFWTRLSPRGVPRMGAGDWNDGLSAIGNQLQAESVWLAHFLIGIVEDWAEMEAQRAKPDARAIAKYWDEAAKMREAVNRHFWDGEWYVRATKDSGEEIGSKRCAEGRIFLNAQTWAILSRVVPESRMPKLLRSLEQHLYKDYGPLLLAPAYTKPDAEIGYLTRYSPGSRENGGLYTHAGVWAILAECVLGRRDMAWKLYQSFCPVLRGMDPELYKAEPYVTPGNVDGPDSPFYGRGGWTWYTGSAAWLFRVSTEWILGVRPAWDGLVVRPCLPPAWKGFHMTRVFRGATYEIVVRAGSKPRIRVDGKPWASDVIPAFGDGRRHLVEVTLVAERAARITNGKTSGRPSKTRGREPATTR